MEPDKMISVRVRQGHSYGSYNAGEALRVEWQEWQKCQHALEREDAPRATGPRVLRLPIPVPTAQALGLPLGPGVMSLYEVRLIDGEDEQPRNAASRRADAIVKDIASLIGWKGEDDGDPAEFVSREHAPFMMRFRESYIAMEARMSELTRLVAATEERLAGASADNTRLRQELTRLQQKGGK